MRTELASRRTLLKGGLAVGGLLALGATIGGSLHLPGPAAGLTTLSPSEVEVITAISDVMFPGAPFPLTGVQAGVVEEVDHLVHDNLGALHAAGFRYLLRALEWGTLPAHGARFSQLDRSDRIEVLQIWGDPDVLTRRVAFDALKAVMGMAYFAHPDVQAHIGWRSTCRGGVS